MLKKAGHKVGYFKPIGRKKETSTGKILQDSDTILMKTLLDLKESLEDICPILLSREFILQVLSKEKRKETIQKIVDTFERVSANYDIIIIEGQQRNQDMAVLGLCNPVFGKILQAKSLIITNGEEYSLMDDIFLQKEYFGLNKAELAGILFNNVSSHAIKTIRYEFIPVIKNQTGLKTYGIIPIESKLISPTVEDVFKITGGSIIEADSKEARLKLVENLLIGAMSPENAIKYFRRTLNNCLITGGDRPDLLAAALETKQFNVLICTGNLYPPVTILVKAREYNVPVILVPYDTNTTARLLANAHGYISLENKEKIKLTQELIDKHVDWKGLIDSL
ncbi:MAG: phosphotransacetylase family protein [Candidatus Helarchaeota archaeon]|nr:phosphotransacetylase family protein [Candidatus Helarchaeota archaeon]